MSLPLTAERRQVEWQKTITIARNNRFPLHLIAKLKTHIQHKTHIENKTNIQHKTHIEHKTNIQHKTHTTKDDTKQWATFTYYSPKIRKITNFFKQTNIYVAFKSTHTIQQQTIPPTSPQKTMPLHTTTIKVVHTN